MDVLQEMFGADSVSKTVSNMDFEVKVGDNVAEVDLKKMVSSDFRIYVIQSLSAQLSQRPVCVFIRRP